MALAREGTGKICAHKQAAAAQKIAPRASCLPRKADKSSSGGRRRVLSRGVARQGCVNAVTRPDVAFIARPVCTMAGSHATQVGRGAWARHHNVEDQASGALQIKIKQGGLPRRLCLHSARRHTALRDRLARDARRPRRALDERKAWLEIQYCTLRSLAIVVAPLQRYAVPLAPRKINCAPRAAPYGEPSRRVKATRPPRCGLGVGRCVCNRRQRSAGRLRCHVGHT